MNSIKPHPPKRTEFLLEDRTHLPVMLLTAFPRRLQAARKWWVRSPDIQKDERWTHGQGNRTKFSSSVFHQALPLKHLPGTSSLLTYLQQQAALQVSTFFSWLIFHNSESHLAMDYEEGTVEDPSKHFNAFHWNPLKTEEKFPPCWPVEKVFKAATKKVPN